ncbi:MAG: hypothetical protein ACLSAH_19375 [Bilophila wadsworthia]
MGSLTPPYASLLYLGIRIGKVDFVEILPMWGCSCSVTCRSCSSPPTGPT